MMMMMMIMMMMIAIIIEMVMISMDATMSYVLVTSQLKKYVTKEWIPLKHILSLAVKIRKGKTSAMDT